RFQDVEEAHIKQMREYLNTYGEVLENNHDLIGQVHIEFKRQCLEMTVDKLLEQFVLNKYTGLEKPGSIEFEELNMSGLTTVANQTPDSSEKTTNGDKPSKKEGNLESGGQKPKESKTSRRTTSLLNLFMSSSQGSKECSGNPEGGSLPTSAPTSPTSGVGVGAGATSLARNPLRGSKCNLSTCRKPASIDDSREDKDDSRKSETPTPEVDEEGYCIRPKVDLWENDKGSFYSSSDTDSEWCSLSFLRTTEYLLNMRYSKIGLIKLKLRQPSTPLVQACHHSLALVVVCQ
ncbi:hypothetical protein L9F63_022262, partial [Diploptera punctata]